MGGEVAQSLVRADGVVHALPSAQLAVEFFHFQRAGGDLVKLLGVSAVGAFEGAIEFGGARRKHEPAHAALLAGQLEFGGELRAAVGDKRFAARFRNGGRFGPRSDSDDGNPSRPGGLGPPGSTPRRWSLTVPIGVVFHLWLASCTLPDSVTNHSEREQ